MINDIEKIPDYETKSVALHLLVNEYNIPFRCYSLSANELYFKHVIKKAQKKYVPEIRELINKKLLLSNEENKTWFEEMLNCSYFDLYYLIRVLYSDDIKTINDLS